jgi:ABC-2 type transport system permease protein
MNFKRILAIVIRHLYNLKNNLDELADSFYYPAMDLIIWGLTSQYFAKNSSGIPNLILILLTGLIFWQTVWRSQYEITVSLLNELWSRNLVNLFASPLTINEWMAGLLLLGLVKLILTSSVTLVLVWIFYSINLLQFSFALLPFFALLIISGWWIGFLVTGIILRFGKSLQNLAWAGVYLLSPFSAVYYPVEVLPLWAQKISLFVPTSYVFEGMREVLRTGQISWQKFFISLGLNLWYLISAVFFLRQSFIKAKKSGLTQLDEG